MAEGHEKCSHCGPCHNRKDILEKVLQRIEVLLDREESVSTSPSLQELKTQVANAQYLAGDLLDHGPPVDHDLSASQRLTPVDQGPLPIAGERPGRAGGWMLAALQAARRPEPDQGEGGRATHRHKRAPERLPGQDFSGARVYRAPPPVQATSYSDAEEEGKIEVVD